MHNGYGIAIAWPETKCKQAGAWYDSFMTLIGLNKKGYYKVGHAALILLDKETNTCKYFDFGRYHTPYGYGRVRSMTTDFDLEIKTKACFKNGSISNLELVLEELQQNNSTHGTGYIKAAILDINIHKTERYIQDLIQKESIPYGPFIKSGTNCSRFVCDALLKGEPKWPSSLALKFPIMFTPTPLWNLYASFTQIVKLTTNEKFKQNTYSTKSA
jgi:hypothetical protein